MAEIRDTELGQEKKCTRCGEWWPNDLEFFPRCARNKGGLDTFCRACRTDAIRNAPSRKKRSTMKREVDIDYWDRYYKKLSNKIEQQMNGAVA